MMIQLTDDFRKWMNGKEDWFKAVLHIDKAWLDEHYPEGARAYLEDVHRLFSSAAYETVHYGYKVDLGDFGRAPWVSIMEEESERWERTDNPFELVKTAEYMILRMQRLWYRTGTAE